MSKQSDSVASLKPERASDAETTILVSNPIGLTELSVSLEALTLGPDSPATIMQCTQTISPRRGRESTGSPEKRDSKKASPSPGPKPRRYALEMWLEVEVGPGLFTPPEDDSFSVNYAMEAVNRAYPGCTGVYLGREGHMLAFYGRKGSTRAGLTCKTWPLKPARPLANYPRGWDSRPGGRLGVSASLRRMKP